MTVVLKTRGKNEDQRPKECTETYAGDYEVLQAEGPSGLPTCAIVKEWPMLSTRIVVCYPGRTWRAMPLAPDSLSSTGFVKMSD
ncbi:hypothetical protein AC579_5901 [Pseudocercospora musae]|uniref:Uncharacterized protein n=1 Tax=Pseudocercospora musae TaxID=113226 RepID=A0A139ITB8_9PEZI|nr:hypothetical protein AC579_5901 [Pseudocercospora musae]